MPWIRTFKLGLVWVAFTENDWHEISCQRIGWSQRHAENRCLKALPS